ncbi:triose-phosphate isomerase [Bacteriovoracaceae bacterium]|nr:triose-phosphate isomerase [Bacteriovoracaceae bacterium]
MSRKKYMLGNWKMNHGLEEIDNFLSDLDSPSSFNCFWGIAPQAIHILRMIKAKKRSPNLKVGSQNCSENDFGAFTGELAVQTLVEAGVDFTLAGHSERRSLYSESDELINAKVIKAQSENLLPVFCLGETLEERDSGKMENVLEGQLLSGLKNVDSKNIVIAYEPVWAIGTGKTATPEQADEAHAFIRKVITEKLDWDANKISILYGGSVKPANVVELLGKENIDGALVGGASLTGASFSALCKAASN